MIFTAKKIFKGRLTLDAGCGYGDFLRHHENAIGIDLNLKHLMVAKKYNDVVRGSVTCLPFKKEKFEAIRFHNVIEHLAPKDAYLTFREMAKVLKVGGYLVVRSEMPHNSFWENPTHIRPYPPKSIEKMITSGSQETFEAIKNLKIEKIYYTGKYSNKKLFFILLTIMAHFLRIGKRGYWMVISKVKSSSAH